MSKDREPREEKEIAASLRLRADPPRVMRLSRRTLTVLGAVGGLGLGAILIVALQDRKPVDGPSELYSTERIQTAEGLSRLPTDYTNIPQLGPPLPGVLVSPRDPLFDLADAGEVLVEFCPVVLAQGLLQPLGVGSDQVQDALADAVATLADLGIFFGPEQSPEDRPRADFLGDGGGGGFPRDVGRVGTTVAGITVAGVAATFDSDLK